MATTTNYGWDTPDDTDLVKDGAAAIRTLGSSVDTTIKALNPSTTLGDIEYRSATANTNTRLALGTAGQLLAVNSGATAPEWVAAPSSGGMTLLSTTSLSGTSTTVSSINQTYTDLIVMVRGFTYNTNAITKLVTSGTNFDAAMLFDTTANNDQLQFSTSTAAGSSTNIAVVIFKDYANTTYRKALQVFGRTHQRFTGGGATQGTGALSSITVTTDAGTSTFSTGQVLIYGVK
jgi:hypothetical protein